MSSALIIPGKAGTDAPQSVLFICTMNAIRSPMASAIARTLYPQQIYFRSAGMFAGEPDGFVTTVMNEAKVDISTHNPRTFDELDDDLFDLIIALTPEAKDRILEGPQGSDKVIELWSVADPTLTAGSRNQRLDAYRAVRDELARMIKRRFSWSD